MTISAEAEGIRATKQYTVSANPVASIDLGVTETSLRTGDVLHLNATPKRTNGTPVTDVALTWSYTYAPDDSIAPNGFPGGGGIVQFGRFVANYPGRYTLLAQYGRPAPARRSSRAARRPPAHHGHGPWQHHRNARVRPVAVDGGSGRDYFLVAPGAAMATRWSSTSRPGHHRQDRRVQVNARTINDVTVFPTGVTVALARRRVDRVNGVVFLDPANTAHPKVRTSARTDGVVHNIFETTTTSSPPGREIRHRRGKDSTNPKYLRIRHPNARLQTWFTRHCYSAPGGVVRRCRCGHGKYGGTIGSQAGPVYRVNIGHEIFPYFRSDSSSTFPLTRN